MGGSSQKGSPMRRPFGIAIALIGVLVVALVVVGATGLINLRNPLGVEQKDRSQPALLVSIQDLSEYHAAAGNFQVIVDVENDVKYVPSFLAGDRSLFVAAGSVDAYVDFAGLADGDLTLSEDGKSATIRLPKPKLDKPNLDQKRTYLYSEDRGVFDRVGDAFSSDDQQDLYVLAEKKLTAAAKDSELVDQAKENTKDMLVGMFKALKIDVTVAFGEEPPKKKPKTEGEPR